MPIGFEFAAGHERWPTDARNCIATSMESAVTHYNMVSEGRLEKHLTVAWHPDVPTADGNINGHIRFGGTCSHRIALHEIAHTLGVGTHPHWRCLLSGGAWQGPRAIALLRNLDGPDAILSADAQHFWPYGLNYDREWSEENGRRHVYVVLAVLQDLEGYSTEVAPFFNTPHDICVIWQGIEPAPIYRFQKQDMTFYCHSGWPGFSSMSGWGWGTGVAAFHAWAGDRQIGTVEIHVFRKGEMVFLCHELWEHYHKMKGWGWSRDGACQTAFHAFPPESEISGTVAVVELRKAENTFYGPHGGELASALANWGWRQTRVAFRVPA